MYIGSITVECQKTARNFILALVLMEALLKAAGDGDLQTVKDVLDQGVRVDARKDRVGLRDEKMYTVNIYMTNLIYHY